MKVVLGIDQSLASQAALELVLRMKFQDLHLTLVHSVESVLPAGEFIDAQGHAIPDLATENLKSSSVLLREAQEQAELYGVEAHARTCLGDPPQALEGVANEIGANLIAVGRHRRPVWQEILLGSTPKRLLHESKRHLLIAHGPVEARDKLKVLFAVDQRFETSAYIKAFVEMRPKGVGEIEVLTVNCTNDEDVRELVHGLPVTTEVAEGWASAGLRQRNTSLTKLFGALGVPSIPRVAYGNIPDNTLADIAERDNADLVVVGAHRHGFLDRHLHHSVSEGLLAAGPHGLMVLRPEVE
ncbi:MAG: universal stress protein [Fimbriimonas sp.]